MPLRTFLAILWICNLTFLVGCASLVPQNDEELSGGQSSVLKERGPVSDVFEASYDEVWRALQKTVVKFPIVINNIDQGVLETEPVKINQFWPRPFPQEVPPRGKYVLRITVVKGVKGGADATKIIIGKKVGIERDFFSEEKQLPSDGYEESMILYRIEREVTLERTLKKAFEGGKI